MKSPSCAQIFSKISTQLEDYKVFCLIDYTKFLFIVTLSSFGNLENILKNKMMVGFKEAEQIRERLVEREKQMEETQSHLTSLVEKVTSQLNVRTESLESRLSSLESTLAQCE